MPTSIQANRVVTYALNHKAGERDEHDRRNENLMQNRPEQIYNGQMSKAAKKKIKTIVPNLALLEAARQTRNGKTKKLGKKSVMERLKTKKPVLSFITLTLASEQQHPDNQIKRDCLQPFLASLKRKCNMYRYLWVAELQKNGNIHFHIVTPSYIRKEEIRSLWNYHQNSLGYVDRSRYASPPSTQIEACRSIQSTGLYISKYLTKEPEIPEQDEQTQAKEQRRIEGRLWGCDEETEKLTAITIEDGQSVQVIDEAIRASTFVMEDKYFSLYYYDISRSQNVIEFVLSMLERKLLE